MSRDKSCDSYRVSFLAVDNYGSFGDDNTSDEDDDDNDNYYESGLSPVTLPESDSSYPDFGVPNSGSLIKTLSQISLQCSASFHLH